jgi:hypothetical protein
MAGVKVEDIIIPEVFNPYVLQETALLSAVRNSGIAETIPEFSVPRGGVSVKLPFLNDAAALGAAETLSDASPLTAKKVTAGKDVAAILERGVLISVSDLAESESGGDLQTKIAQRIIPFWVNDEQIVLNAILKGIFASASMSDNILDISGETDNVAKITRDSIVDAISLLGDASPLLTGVFMHSAVKADLEKKALLDPRVNGQGIGTQAVGDTYQGRRIIVDDSLAPVGDVYTTYFFGNGAFAFAEGEMPVPNETERDAAAGTTSLASRRRLILHPRGISWTGVAAGNTPTIAELAVGTNWTRVYENKNVRITALRHKIGPLSA